MEAVGIVDVFAAGLSEHGDFSEDLGLGKDSFPQNE